MIESAIASRDAAVLDAADPLAPLRKRFHLPRAQDGGPAVYFCGNSLGPMPVAAEVQVQRVLEAWSTLAVRGHHDGRAPWLSYHEPFAAPLARLVGAAPGEVVAMNTLTVNLHLMLTSFYRPTAERHRLLIEQSAFPSDRYAVVSQLALHGLSASGSLLEVAPRPGEATLRTEDLIVAIERAGSSLALVLLPGVQYLSGQRLDLKALAGAARRVGARVGFDLAHSIGNVPLELHDSGADFAVWCSYKYLCGGPGAVAGAFVHERHARDAALPRLSGWWGHDAATRFAMGPDFTAMPGAEGWQLSNPPILSLAPLAAALELFDAAGMTALREKSLALTQRLRTGLERRCGRALEVLTPMEPAEHGAQLSVRIAGGATRGREVFARLGAAGVIGDWREPDVVRLAPAPLYNTFAEVDRAIEHVAAAVGAR
jgi:kynureninase